MKWNKWNKGSTWFCLLGPITPKPRGPRTQPGSGREPRSGPGSVSSRAKSPAYLSWLFRGFHWANTWMWSLVRPRPGPGTGAGAGFAGLWPEGREPMKWTIIQLPCPRSTIKINKTNEMNKIIPWSQTERNEINNHRAAASRAEEIK